ncbi:hypothetical protein OG500_10610 [Kitasatospora sp. NBC_01250]|uniref:hypothetical protein n=1 Tax=Kitasatospora sp. NBC_01250 TaxID=2903571 RepID=UPI002E310C88|nr:hypothetical protein [Kitasatospora sp. NBC_01250]
MVGVLIEMRTAIQRRSAQGRRGYGTLALLLVVTLLAVSSLLAGFTHYRHPGAGTDVLAVLCFGWLLGWITGPVLTGDDATLRLDYFKLLPIPPRKLAFAMLGAAFTNVSLLFSLIAFGALVAFGAQSGAGPALVGLVAVLLELALAVVASTVAVAVLGPAVSSRRGRDFGTMLIALAITGLSLASGSVPFLAGKLTSGRSPVLSAVVRALPSGWGALAVDAAGRGAWAESALALAGLALLTGALVLAWPPLLGRRLAMAPGGRSRATARGRTRANRRRPLLPATALGAVIRKELRLYSRSMLRSVQLMIAFLVGVLVCVVPALSGVRLLLPFAGVLFTAIAAACATNLYGDDGSALWLTLVTPNVERADVRGRQWAWLLVVGPAALLLTVVLTAVSGQRWAWPWALAAEPALLLGGAGVLVLVSILTVFPLTATGGPTPPRQLKVNLMLFATLLVTLAPPLVPLIAGAATGSGALSWLAVPVGLGWGALLCWGLGRLALRRLERRGPEVFALARTPAG